MKAARQPLAVVLDEYGGTSGIVTLKNLVSRLLGDIGDEFAPAAQELRVLGDGSVVADGLMLIEDVNEQLGTHFDASEVDTLGGLVFARSAAGRESATTSISAAAIPPASRAWTGYASPASASSSTPLATRRLRPEPPVDAPESGRAERVGGSMPPTRRGRNRCSTRCWAAACRRAEVSCWTCSRCPGSWRWSARSASYAGYRHLSAPRGECELVAIAAMEKRAGVGTALLEALKREAGPAAARIWVITTNDNLEALRFYQRRGFALCAVYPRAVDDARQRLKPRISASGAFGIPLRDELDSSCGSLTTAA